MTIILVWAQTVQNMSEERERLDVGLISIEVSDLLLKHAGFPTAWETDNRTYTIGLAFKDHVLNSNKVNKFLSFSYDNARLLLGTRNYQFYFLLINATDKKMFNSGGRYPVNPALAVNSHRLVMINSTPAYMDLTIWR